MALSYLLGAMGVVDVFQAALEELIRHQLLEGKGNSGAGETPNNTAGAGA